MKRSKITFFMAFAALGLITSCSDDDDTSNGPDEGEVPFVGAVYAMTNGNGQVEGTNVQGPNSVLAFGRDANGELTQIGTFSTNGNGGDYDGGEGLDPLIAAYSLTKTNDNENVLAVNAGSNTIVSFNVADDFSLEMAGDPVDTGAIGPNSIATTDALSIAGSKGIVYVTNITRQEFLAGGEPENQGTVKGFLLLEDGSLQAIPGSTRNLPIRPSSVQFSPDGNWLVVTGLNAGAAALASGSNDEVTVFQVGADGTLSTTPTGTAISTLRDNEEGRNLPAAIGFQVVGDNYVVVTEAREFQPDGMPPVFPALQDGSVSTWQIQGDGTLTPITLDVRAGDNNTSRTACWLDFTLDGSTFFVATSVEAALASYSFDNGVVALLNPTAAQGQGTGGADNGPDAFASTDGWIDVSITDDGEYLYQLFGLDGTIGIYSVNGQSLDFVGEVSGLLPDTNTQGLIAM